MVFEQVWMRMDMQNVNATEGLVPNGATSFFDLNVYSWDDKMTHGNHLTGLNVNKQKCKGGFS